MVDFDDRKRVFEKKFEHDEELKFKVMARASKLLGLWAAGQMGLAGADAEAYAASVVEADMDQPGHDDVLGKIEHDFQSKKVAVSRAQLTRELEVCLRAAQEALATQ